MLRSLSVMFDYRLVATDGEVGRIRDFLFDDESWIVHYLVTDVREGGESREVLVIPFTLGFSDWMSRQLSVPLTRGEINRSPSIEFDMPISLQQETGLRKHGSHLRSLLEVLGYTVHAADGEIGTVEDFVVEDTLWGVHRIIVALRRFPGRSVELDPRSIRTISWSRKAAWLELSSDEIEKSPDFEPAKPVNHDSQSRLYDYYGRPFSPLPMEA